MSSPSLLCAHCPQPRRGSREGGKGGDQSRSWKKSNYVHAMCCAIRIGHVPHVPSGTQFHGRTTEKKK